MEKKLKRGREKQLFAYGGKSQNNYDRKNINFLLLNWILISVKSKAKQNNNNNNKNPR